MKLPFLFVALVYSLFGFSQGNKDIFIVKHDTSWPCQSKYPNVVTTMGGDTVLRLDSSKYYHCFTDTFSNFAVVGITHKHGWWAIDIHEHLLFEVFNAGYTELDPDRVKDGMIRILDKNGKVGFANNIGHVVIKPQFDDASVFYKGRALVYIRCEKISIDDEHYHEGCTENGYIDKLGVVKWLPNYSNAQMRKKLKWPDGL